jgi:hypothetical protein
VLEKLHVNLNEMISGMESTKEITVQES